MKLPTIPNDQEDFDQSYYSQLFDNEVSSPLVKLSPASGIVESEESCVLNKFGKIIVSNLLIFVGGLGLFESAGSLFYIFTFKNEHPILPSFICFIIGLILTFLGIGNIKRKSDVLLFIIIPLIGVISQMFMRPIIPFMWFMPGFVLFYHYSLYLLSLIIFYYVKDYVGTSQD